jgi:hypothetical protein
LNFVLFKMNLGVTRLRHTMSNRFSAGIAIHPPIRAGFNVISVLMMSDMSARKDGGEGSEWCDLLCSTVSSHTA